MLYLDFFFLFSGFLFFFSDVFIFSSFFEEDPFKTLDQNGVGKLVQLAVKLGRSTRP